MSLRWGSFSSVFLRYALGLGFLSAAPHHGIIPAGTYQLIVCVYSKNREKFPQSTFGSPNDPYGPNLSATDF